MAIDSKFDNGVIRNSEASGTIAQYHYVKLTSGKEGIVEECDTAGEDVWGICIDYGITDGTRCDIFVGPGFCKIQAGAATTVNTNLQTDADGEAIDASTGDVYVGMGMQAAGAADEIIEMYFYGPTHLDKQGD